MIFLSDIVEFVKALEVKAHEIQIVNALGITDQNFGNNSIGWCSDKNKNILLNIKEGNVLVSREVYKELNEQVSLFLIPVDQPRLSFIKILQKFFVPEVKYGNVSSTAQIDASVKYNPSNVIISPNVVIEENCVIGNSVIIGANTVIKANTIIENGCKIGANCTIGGVGFGYELNENQEYELMPHIGNVHLKENVEIGNNVCIDRAVMGSTLLSENVKVDNLVHIAHGVQIGRNSLIIANSMIAGSVEIGENVWVSPSASIRQKLTVENDALVGMGAVVVKDVASSSVVAGNPAKPFPKK